MSSTGPEANRFAPPVAHVEDVESAASGQLAGRGIRLVAAIIDGLLVGLVIFLVAWSRPTTPSIRARMRSGSCFVLNMVLGFGAYLLLNGWLLHSRAARPSPRRCSRSRWCAATAQGLVAAPRRTSLFRHSLLSLVPVIGWIYAIVDALLIFRDSRKCLHDNIADTIVVRA